MAKYMKTILLKSGEKVLVDKEDFALLNSRKWHMDSQGYARSYVSRKKFMSMHRLVNDTQEGKITDHINQNKLDNRKCNLRTASRSLNTRNAPIRIDNTSGYKGVCKRGNRWEVGIGHNKVHIHVGSYGTKIEAARAYDEASVKYHGKFGKLNFPEEK